MAKPVPRRRLRQRCVDSATASPWLPVTCRTRKAAYAGADREGSLILLSRYERMIAGRYLLPGKGERFIALVAAFSLFAVMLGVAALVIVMSEMNGFRAELFDKIVGLNGHAVVQGIGGPLPNWRHVIEIADATPGVTSATPLIQQPLMAHINGRVEIILLDGMT